MELEIEISDENGRELKNLPAPGKKGRCTESCRCPGRIQAVEETGQCRGIRAEKASGTGSCDRAQVEYPGMDQAFRGNLCHASLCHRAGVGAL